jgi:hypothetical protein
MILMSFSNALKLHPTLSKLSNKLFYHNELIDGVSSNERAPLSPDIPTLLFCDTKERGQVDFKNSLN